MDGDEIERSDVLGSHVSDITRPLPDFDLAFGIEVLERYEVLVVPYDGRRIRRTRVSASCPYSTISARSPRIALRFTAPPVLSIIRRPACAVSTIDVNGCNRSWAMTSSSGVGDPLGSRSSAAALAFTSVEMQSVAAFG